MCGASYVEYTGGFLIIEEIHFIEERKITYFDLWGFVPHI